MQWVEGPPDGQPEAPPSAGPLPPLAHDEVDAAAPEPQRETARAAQASGDAAHAVDVPEIADMESPGIDSSPAGVTVVGEEARSGFDSLELGNAPLLEARSQASVAWHPETGWQQGADSTPLAAERDYAPSILAPWRYLYSAGGWRWENLLCPLWSMLLLVEAFIAWSYLTGRWLPKDLEGEEIYVLLRQPSVLVALLCMGYVAVALGTAIPVAHMFLRPADKVRLDAYVADEADIRNDTLRRSKTLMSRLQADGEGTLRGAVVDLEGIAERHAHRCVALRRGVQPDVLLWVRRILQAKRLRNYVILWQLITGVTVPLLSQVQSGGALGNLITIMSAHLTIAVGIERATGSQDKLMSYRMAETSVMELWRRLKFDPFSLSDYEPQSMADIEARLDMEVTALAQGIEEIRRAALAAEMPNMQMRDVGGGAAATPARQAGTTALSRITASRRVTPQP